jgi:hypothetical protein
MMMIMVSLMVVAIGMVMGSIRIAHILFQFFAINALQPAPSRMPRCCSFTPADIAP